MANDIEAPTALATTTGVSASSVNFDNVNTDLNTLDNKVVQLKENRDSWKEKCDNYDVLLGITPCISVPSFTFNGVTCNNVDFLFMGFAQSAENKGKAIYMSANLLPEVKVSMDDLLKIGGTIQTDKGVGECDIGTAAATSLETAISSITGKSLQPYVREYDGKTHTEKVFFPLECEVFGRTKYAADEATLNKYPQWEGFEKSPDSKIKYIDYQQNKYRACSWWEANKSRSSGCFCLVGYDGLPYISYSDDYGVGCGVAFCL